MFFIPFGKNWVLKCSYHFPIFSVIMPLKRTKFYTNWFQTVPVETHTIGKVEGSQVWPTGPKDGKGKSYEAFRSFVYLYCFTKKVLAKCACLIYLQQATRIFCSSLSLDSRKPNANYEYDDNPQPYTCRFEATIDDRFLWSNVIFIKNPQKVIWISTSRLRSTSILIYVLQFNTIFS